MTTNTTERLVDDYLHRLEVAAARLPPHRRTELLAEIREHIDAALLESEVTGGAAVRDVLERLGPPEEIAVAAIGPAPEGVPVSTDASSSGRLEFFALLVLVVGPVLPIVGWLVGVVLVTMSNAWSNRSKVFGLLLGVIPTLLAIAVFSGSGESTPMPVASGAPPPIETESGDAGIGPLVGRHTN